MAACVAYPGFLRTFSVRAAVCESAGWVGREDASRRGRCVARPRVSPSSRSPSLQALDRINARNREHFASAVVDFSASAVMDPTASAVMGVTRSVCLERRRSRKVVSRTPLTPRRAEGGAQAARVGNIHHLTTIPAGRYRPVHAQTHTPATRTRRRPYPPARGGARRDPTPRLLGHHGGRAVPCRRRHEG